MILQNLIIVSFIITFAYAGFFDSFRPCHYYETCECGTSQPWIRNPHGESVDGKLK